MWPAAVLVGTALLGAATIPLATVPLGGGFAGSVAQWLYAQLAPAVSWLWPVFFAPLVATLSRRGKTDLSSRTGLVVVFALLGVCIVFALLAAASFTVPPGRLADDASPLALCIGALVFTGLSVYALRVVTLPSLRVLLERRERDVSRIRDSLRGSPKIGWRATALAGSGTLVVPIVLAQAVADPGRVGRVAVALGTFSAMITVFSAFFTWVCVKIPRRDQDTRGLRLFGLVMAVLMSAFGLTAAVDIAARVSSNYVQFGGLIVIFAFGVCLGTMDRWLVFHGREIPISFGAVVSVIVGAIYARIAVRRIRALGDVRAEVRRRVSQYT